MKELIKLTITKHPGEVINYQDLAMVYDKMLTRSYSGPDCHCLDKKGNWLTCPGGRKDGTFYADGENNKVKVTLSLGKYKLDKYNNAALYNKLVKLILKGKIDMDTQFLVHENQGGIVVVSYLKEIKFDEHNED